MNTVKYVKKKSHLAKIRSKKSNQIRDEKTPIDYFFIFYNYYLLKHK